MEGRKRAKTDAPSASGALQAVQQLIQKLSACLATPDQSASRPEAEAPQLGGLITELLALQQQLGGTAAQGVLDQALGDVLRQLEVRPVSACARPPKANVHTHKKTRGLAGLRPLRLLPYLPPTRLPAGRY